MLSSPVIYFLKQISKLLYKQVITALSNNLWEYYYMACKTYYQGEKYYTDIMASKTYQHAKKSVQSQKTLDQIETKSQKKQYRYKT